MKIVVNASNLHVGGGVQVAASFISELYKLQEFDLSIVCSSTVFENLPCEVDVSKFNSFVICDIFGCKWLSKTEKSYFDGYNSCLTLFGPFYYRPKVKNHFCGFAQAWIAYPNNIAYQQLSLKQWLIAKFKFFLQSVIFRQYKHLIVEQHHIKDALNQIGYKSNISVVKNCVSSVYDDISMWSHLNFNLNLLKESVTLGFIGRAYPHKNLSVLKIVNKILIEKYNFKCNFLFTFSQQEMDFLGFSHLDNFHSVGVINSNQCPSFYELLDALVFPSLLECFSASPIEAMKMNTTVIASNFPFVREVCGNAAFYFEPLDAENIAEIIYYVFSNPKDKEDKINTGVEVVKNLSTARERAISYLDIVKNNAKPNH